MRRCDPKGHSRRPTPFSWLAPQARTWISSSPTTNGSRAGRLTASSSSWPWAECRSEPAMGPFARLIQSRRRPHSVRPPGHFHAYRNIVFDGHGQQRRRVDFEISECGWNYPCEMGRAALRHQFEGNLLVLGSLAGKLNFQIGVNGCGCGGRFGQAGAHGDHGKLRPARDLDHMKVAVAVPGIKRFDRHRDQKIALSGVANSLASCRVAHTLALMQRMGYMVGESALFENPLAIRCGQHRKGQKRKGHQDGLLHKFISEAQNLTDTDRRAATNAPAVTMATGPCAEAMPWTFSPLLF